MAERMEEDQFMRELCAGFRLLAEAESGLITPASLRRNAAAALGVEERRHGRVCLCSLPLGKDIAMSHGPSKRLDHVYGPSKRHGQVLWPRKRHDPILWPWEET
ncbi:hypothetical protein ZIOFF_044188 [Zingiber officinale]|uniref:Uncharacterized protein n=1 Tax=Zingiber officinale TaxID=94328 RepID=A0A8J5G0N6_ZINOF|nr:hypothetical protein ZIOFF_044188 [Zingiber officinale]